MSGEDETLSRELGLLGATTIGLGTMIGGGIFILPSLAAANAGPASMASFAIGGIISLLAVLSHAELATDMPTSGGGYAYVTRAFSPLAGSVVGWSMWAGLMFASAFYAIGFGQYLRYFYSDLSVVVAGLVMAAVVIGINYYGTSETGLFQNLVVIALVGLIVAFVGTGIPHVDRETLVPLNPGGWSAVVATAGTVYVTFIGFEVIAASAEDIEEPSRNLPRSMLASVLIATLLYVVVMFVSTGVLPRDELGASQMPVADVAAAYFGSIGAGAVVLGALLATVSSTNASVLSASRVSFAMGEDDVLPERLAAIHDSFGTPHLSILLTGIVVFALIGARTGLKLLAEVAGMAHLVAFALVHLAVIALRGEDDYDPTFRIPDRLYPWVPVVGFFASFGVIIQMEPLAIAGGIAIILFGALWYTIVY